MLGIGSATIIVNDPNSATHILVVHMLVDMHKRVPV